MEKTLEQQIEELKAELEIVYKEDSKRFNDAPEGMDFKQFEEYMSVTGKKIGELSRKLRLIDIPTFDDNLPSYGHVMSLEDFIENVKSGGFIDYDGYGNYIRDGKESNIMILPSDVKHDMVRKDFDNIIWYNR
jgi:restriction endonuclease S subunit